GAEIHQRYAEAATVDAERRVAGGDPQVAPQGKLEPTGHSMAFDSRDDRLTELEARRPHRGVALLDAVIAAARRGLLQIEAGAECAARTGEDGDLEVAVGIEATKTLGERSRGRGVHRVARRRAIDGDDG